MKKLLLILLCLPMIGFGQQTYVPDDNFEAYLEGYGMGNGIANDDSVLTANINTVTNLTLFSVSNGMYINGYNISDLTGIEDFTALTHLDCRKNQLTSLDVSQNTDLTTLYCFENQLTSLDVSNNTALTTLYCHSTSSGVQNQLTSLDVSNNLALTHLNCGRNQLTSLDVSNNLALTHLNCYNNQLTSLDISNNTALEGLNCYYNQLTSLNVSNNTALTYLDCYWTQLTTIDVSNNTALISLRCNNNYLTTLDVSNNTALTELWYYYNQLTSLDLSQNTALIDLRCHNNQLTSLDVSNNTVLTELHCYNNQLTTLDVSNNTALTTLYCDDNPNLYCINVDDVAWSTANWTLANGNIDAQHYFSTNCYYGCTDSLALNYDPVAIYDDGSCCYDCGKIEGFVYEDLDSNSVYDSIVEIPLGNQILQLEKSNGGISYLTTQSDGYYSFIVDTGQHVLTYYLPAPWQSSNNNTQYNINIQTDSTYSGLDFGIIREFTKGDMAIDLTTSNTVCNNTAVLWLTVRNLGTETITGVDIDLWVSNLSTISSASGAGVISGNHVSWNLPGNFYPFIYAGQDTTFSVDVLIPAGPQNTSFIDSARVTPVQPNLIEIDLNNNFTQVSNILLCSFDPNDKQVLPKKCFYNELDTLDFTIRFQNTGNYPATTVRLVDTLDLEKLNIMSFQVLGASHDYQWSLKAPSVLEVVFDSIMLVDSAVSFNESQGFFKYRIVVRDSLTNLQPTATPAFIYFDLNAPVVTNLPEVNFIHPGMPYTNLQDICNGQSVTVGNNTYTTSGTYADTISCDSIIVTVLTVNASTSNTSHQTACNTYTWIDGVTYTASNNTATYTTTNSNGCDSVITLDLTINSPSTSTDTQVHCDSYTWLDGVTYTTSNNSAAMSYTNAVNCDSTVTLDLTINNSTTSTDIQVHCDTYIWIDGVTYTASNNTATYTTTNSNGCDSVITLDLTVTGNPISTITQNGIDLEVTISDAYIWNTSATTQTITPTVNGWYWCVVTDANGCIGDTAFYEVTNIVSAINETTGTDRKLLRITDMLGQETTYRRNTPLFYIYDDGTVEKRIVID